MIEHLGAVREPIDSGAGDTALGSILLLGEDNPQSSRPEFQLYCRPQGCAGERLQSRVLGLSADDYLAIWRTNLCSPTWDQLVARRRMRDLLVPETPWATIVCLGRKVAKIAEIVADAPSTRSFAPFDTCELMWRKLIFLPHPSGRCREWNDPTAFGRAQRLMTQHVPTIAWGGRIT